MMDFEQDVKECIRVLESGGLILYPTDTIWGIGCDATNEDAVRRIFSLKQREESKSLIVLVAGKSDILKYVSAPDPELFDFLDTLEEPTTIIYDGAIGLAPGVLGRDGSVGIRLVQELFCRHLLKRFRKPIVSTSANMSGRPAPESFADIDPQVKAGVDYIVSYRQEDESPAIPSTVIKWSNGTKQIIRP